MYVFRVTLMYLIPFAAGWFAYTEVHSYPYATALTLFGLGLAVYRREKAFAMYRRAVKDVEDIIQKGEKA
jgi:hypothetical protein